MAKEFTQTEGVDYEETISPMVRFAFIQLLLVMVAHLDLVLFQMDVKTAFLNDNLEEEIYMDQPIGFVSRDKRTRCVVLKGPDVGRSKSNSYKEE